MKDQLKYALSAFVVLSAMAMVGVFFTFTTQYEWVNLILVSSWTFIVIVMSFYVGQQRGAKDSKQTQLMERLHQERNYEMSPEEQERCYKASKGFVAGFLAAAPSLILTAVSLCVSPTGDWPKFILTTLTRFSLGAFFSWFQFVNELAPLIYVPMALVFPLGVGIGYLLGPIKWTRTQQRMDKAKKDKLRQIRRRKKKAAKTTA